MKRRLVILTEIISPYRIPLFNALAQHPEVDLHVIFLAETDPNLRQWRVYKEEIRFSYQVLRSWRKQLGRYNVLINRGVAQELKAASPDAILCGGYNYIASWQALLWARRHSVPFLLWSESNLHELRRGHALLEFLKAEFIRKCDAFVVPGVWAHEYLRAHKVKEELIFTAPNAVDNNLFSVAAAASRHEAARHRSELNLPERYFLFVGRLVREKGIFELLSAYAKLDAPLRQQIGLVFAGDGPCRTQLEQLAASVTHGLIKFPGFVHREQLPTYYALAEALILPTYTDTWGLVVNEAMACGLPIILSRAAGCGPDLVREHWNGLFVEPTDVLSLTSAMQSMAMQRELTIQMGIRSFERSSHFSPIEWSIAMAQALQAVGARD